MTTEKNSLYCKETFQIYKSYTDMIIREINIIKDSYSNIFNEFTKTQEVDFIIDQLRNNVEIKNNLLSISQTYENEIFLKTHIGEKKLNNFITFLFTENDKSVFLLSFVAFEFNFNNKIDVLYEIEKDNIKIRLTDKDNGFRIKIFDSNKSDPMYFTTVPKALYDIYPNIESYINVHNHNKDRNLPYQNILVKNKNKLDLNIDIFSRELIDIKLITYDYDLSKYSDIYFDLEILKMPLGLKNKMLKKEQKNVK